MAREERRRFCIDMTQQIIVRRRILEGVCGQLGIKMPTWAELAIRAINDLEMELKDDCAKKGIDYKGLVEEVATRPKHNDRRIHRGANRNYVDEDV